MYKAKVLLVTVFTLSIVSVSYGLNVVYVDVNGPNDPGTGSYEDPFRRIQDGIDSADNNDTVIIAEGVYTGNGNYDLDPNGKSITIRSTEPNDPEIVGNTIIDPNGAGRGFYFHSGEDQNCVLAGLTLRNGATDGSGGGILCTNSDPVIKNCVIINNSVVWGGGGIYFLNSTSTLQNCIIAGNSADTGGGIRCLSGNPIIINCTVSGNLAVQGDGIYSYNSSVSIENSIIWGNGSEQINVIGGGLVVTYSNIQNGWVGAGNIDTDPCFASFDPNGEPNMWDFHLQSAYGRWVPSAHTEIDIVGDGFIDLLDFAKFANFWRKEGESLPADFNGSGVVDLFDLVIFSRNYLSFVSGRWVFDELSSLCVDAGDPNSDWNPEPWPNGKRINMGAYGGTNQASMNGNIGDFSIDGLVNFIDFAEFSNKWLAEETCIEDLTNDGVINFFDLVIFADNWLWQKQ